MGDKVWQVPQEQFVAAWNAASDLAEAVNKVRELAGGAAPRWAVRARAGTLLQSGVEMKNHPVGRCAPTPKEP
jgi:hypothetical protein